MTNLVAATWLGAEKLLRRWGGGILIVSMLLATAFGVMWLDSRVIRPGRMLASPESPGSGIVVRSEVVHLWLPETLIGLATSQSEHLLAKKHEELRAYLESRGQEKIWYAVTNRNIRSTEPLLTLPLFGIPIASPNISESFWTS